MKYHKRKMKEELKGINAMSYFRLRRQGLYLLLFIAGLYILYRLSMYSTGSEIQQKHTLPTLYEYYKQDGIAGGLDAEGESFRLNGKEIRLFSGAIHYFRVHPKNWKDRLAKLRACGFNTVETYVPWNLHEPEKGKFDFGYGDNDMSIFLQLRSFIRLAQEQDLFVILRPGPYICAEWDFGGLPSWLLRIPNLRVRTSDPKYLERVKIYFNHLLPQVKDLQFTDGGPIIAFQIENELGSFSSDALENRKYMQYIMDVMKDNGLKERLFTCDSPSMSWDRGALPGVLQMANFFNNSSYELNSLRRLQPNKPMMVSEFWSGWFDHWMESYHHVVIPENDYSRNIKDILAWGASINLYMFHGGTTFGFMNGANVQGMYPYYQPDVSSYDYDAPLSEAGDYTAKYFFTKHLVAKFNKVVTHTPEQPPESLKFAYPPVHVAEHLTIEDLLKRVDSKDQVSVPQVTPMELININNNNGQSYGYIAYRKTVNFRKNSRLRIRGGIRDVAMIIVDGRLVSQPFTGVRDLENFGFWTQWNSIFEFDPELVGEHTLDIVVENWGRVNFGHAEDFLQYKGLVNATVELNDRVLHDWKISALQFKSQWVKSLRGWRQRECTVGPCLQKFRMYISETPRDTFLDMSSWGKGVVFVNGFNIGRYMNCGPQHTLYIPAPLLNEDLNEILVFEHYTPQMRINFVNKPLLGNKFP